MPFPSPLFSVCAAPSAIWQTVLFFGPGTPSQGHHPPPDRLNTDTATPTKAPQMRLFRNVFVDPDEHVIVPGAQKQNTWVAVGVGVFAAVGGFIYGYDTGLINSVTSMNYVKHQFASNGVSLTTNEMSILTAILSLGTFFGALSAPLVSDTFGRKIAIIFATFFVFMVGNICQVASQTIILLCVGRFVTGISVGIVSAVVPLYQAEASPKYMRGAIISTYQWAITWGLLVSSAVSQATHSIDSSASYRVPIGLQFLWSLILGFGMLLLPESPRFYIMKDDIHSAARALSRLRRVPSDDPGIIEELVEIKAAHDYELSFGTHSLKDCFVSGEARPHQLKRLFTAVLLQAVQQCSGINFIFYYGVNFFTRTGVSNSYLISFITYAVNVVFTIPGLFLVETIGRRKVLILGGCVMGLANIIIGIVGVTTDSVIANKVMIAFVCVFIASFAATWGPVVWVVTGEIFSLGVRGKSVAISASANWLVNFVFAFITPYLVDTGKHTAALGTKIFFMWGGCNLIGVVIVYFAVYETKGLSLEEINELYRKCGDARSSSKFKVVLNFDRSESEPLEKSDTLDANQYDSTGATVSQNGSVPTRDETQPYHPGYTVDLGYGGGYSRGPPSIITATTEGSFFPEPEEVHYSSLSNYVDSLSSSEGWTPTPTEITNIGPQPAQQRLDDDNGSLHHRESHSSLGGDDADGIHEDDEDDSSSETSLFDE